MILFTLHDLALTHTTIPGEPVVLPLVLPLQRVEDAADLFGSLVEVERGRHQLVALFSTCHKILPPKNTSQR